MAFRTSVKALLLADDPEPPPRPAPLAAARESFAERAPAAERAPERPRISDPIVAPPAPPPAPEAVPPPWPARAAAIRTMAPQLPSAATSQLMLKIAALYDELGTEAPPAPEAEPIAEPSAPVTLAPDEPPATDVGDDDAAGEEELPPDDPALRVPPLAAPGAFPRRALPGRRAVSALRR